MRGRRNIDVQLAKRYARWKKEGQPAPQATNRDGGSGSALRGKSKRLIGGRDYGESQLNHILSRRQPGSAFKPFVYAAAFEGGVDGVQPIVTPATTVMDEPTTFDFDGKEYTPNNYGEKFHGQVTAREALTFSAQCGDGEKSLNLWATRASPTWLINSGSIRLSNLRRRWRSEPMKMTPLEVATGYTILANEGVRTEPMFIRNVTNADGEIAGNKNSIRFAAGPRSARLPSS